MMPVNSLSLVHERRLQHIRSSPQILSGAMSLWIPCTSLCCTVSATALWKGRRPSAPKGQGPTTLIKCVWKAPPHNALELAFQDANWCGELCSIQALCLLQGNLGKLRRGHPHPELHQEAVRPEFRCVTNSVFAYWAWDLLGNRILCCPELRKRHILALMKRWFI